jgi:hypothetical protein
MKTILFVAGLLVAGSASAQLADVKPYSWQEKARLDLEASMRKQAAEWAKIPASPKAHEPTEAEKKDLAEKEPKDYKEPLFQPHVGSFAVKGEAWLGFIEKVNTERTQAWVIGERNNHEGGWVNVADLDIQTRILCRLATSEEVRAEVANRPVAKRISGPTFDEHAPVVIERTPEEIAIMQLTAQQEEANAAMMREITKARHLQEQQRRAQLEMLEIMRREAEIREMRLNGIQSATLPIRR